MRARAAYALGEIGKATEEAVEALILLLQDEDDDVRWDAAWALGQLGDSRAVEPLRQTLSKEESERIQTALREALAKLKGKTLTEVTIFADSRCMRCRGWLPLSRYLLAR